MVPEDVCVRRSPHPSRVQCITILLLFIDSDDDDSKNADFSARPSVKTTAKVDVKKIKKHTHTHVYCAFPVKFLPSDSDCGPMRIIFHMTPNNIDINNESDRHCFVLQHAAE